MNIIDLLKNRLSLAEKIQSENGGFCTYNEAAILIGIDPSSIRFYASKGRLNKTKIGKKVYISLGELGKFCESQNEKKIKAAKEQLKALAS